MAQDDASAEDVVVYGLYKRMDQGWFQNEAPGAEARGEELGIEVVTLDNQFDPNVMSANLDNAITEGASGILMVVPDQQLGAGVIEKARAAGIPLIAIDDSITDANGDPAPFVGMNTAQIGTDVGTMLAGFANDRELVRPGGRELPQGRSADLQHARCLQPADRCLEGRHPRGSARPVRGRHHRGGLRGRQHRRWPAGHAGAADG